MEKIRVFIKNFRKIIIVSLIVLFLVASGSFATQMISMKHKVTETNQRQLAKISAKYVEIKNKLAYLMDEIEYPVDRDMDTVYGLLSLEPEDAYDADYLAGLTDNLTFADNLIILDKNRKLISSAGKLSDIDFSDSYYDELFSGAAGSRAEIHAKGNNTDLIKCINCGTFYLLTQEKEAAEGKRYISRDELWQMARMGVGLDDDSFFAVIDKNDGTVVYADKEELKNKSFDLEVDKAGVLSVDGGNYFAKYYDNDENGVRLFALTPRIRAARKSASATLLTIGIFVFALIILVSYIICLRQDELDPKYEYKCLGKYFLRSQASRFRALAIVTCAASAVLFMLLININDSRFTLAYLDSESYNCAEICEFYRENISTMEQHRDEIMYSRGRIASAFIGRHPEYRNKKGMSELAAALDVAGLTSADREGQTEFTSTPLDNLNFLEDSESPLYELRYALVGKEGIMVSGDGKVVDDNLSLFAVPKRGENGTADGIMVAIVKNGMSGSAYNTVNENFRWLIDYNSTAEDNKHVFWVDNYGVIVSEKTINSDEAVDENTLKDGYCGIVTIDGKKYLAAVHYSDAWGEYLYVIAPVSWFSSYALVSTLLLVVMFVLVALWMWYDGLGSKHHFEKRKKTVKGADDMARTELYWQELSIGKKMGKIIRCCIYAITCGLLVLLILVSRGNIDNTIVSILLTNNWTESVNGYSILINIGTICLFFTGVAVAENMLTRFEKIVGNDGMTGCRLAKSLVKYIGALVCTVIVFTNFGVDALAAVASVGIIGLAVSFGAQELVKDMIAGLFLLFEGNFKVGDMIKLNDDWYWIRSIGVRTTKLEAWGKVRIVNNSNMTGVINIQEALSCANCDLWIDGKYDIDMVEDILTKELPALKANFTPDISTPAYKGIQRVEANRTLIRIRAYCPPIKCSKVERKLRNYVKHILDRYEIHLANESYNLNVTSSDSEQIKTDKQ